jgi:hypothetical protein
MPTLVLDLTDAQLTMLDDAALTELRTRESQALWYLTTALDAYALGGRRATLYWRRFARQAQARRDAWGLTLTELRTLHQQAGRPSARSIAASTAADDGYRTVSHSTVNEVLSGTRIPARWQVVRSIVHVLGGDETRFLELWQQMTPDDPGGNDA